MTFPVALERLLARDGPIEAKELASWYRSSFEDRPTG